MDLADKHIPSKTSRSVSSVPWITPAIRRKIRRKNATHAKAKKSGSAKIRAKFETLRREIKADIRKQHDLYVNNLVGDVKANPKDFYRYINSQKKDAQGISRRTVNSHIRNFPLKKYGACRGRGGHPIRKHHAVEKKKTWRLPFSTLPFPWFKRFV